MKEYIYEGIKYEIPEGLAEKIFRDVDRAYMKEDAINHINDAVYGTDPDSLSGDERAEAEEYFVRTHTVTVSELYDLAADFVSEFEQRQDCNLAENDVWDSIIREYLRGVER